MKILATAILTLAASLAPVASAATPPQADNRAVTVVAVVDSGFTAYHFDFLGSRHPWNLDADPGNDLDFTQDPAAWIEGFPPTIPIHLTLPTSPTDVVSGLRAGADAEAWAAMQTSTLTDPKIYRFPGTKIVAALDFTDASQFEKGNSAHGTRSAASAAGNVNGTCPECVFVLVRGSIGLSWAAAQPWIDVVTNSYGASLVGDRVRDNVYFGAPLDATRAASDAGQTIVFSAGNGLLNAYDVPMLDYWSSEKGPDWVVTVGAVDPFAYRTYIGSGKPVDISSIGDQYPSTGGTTAAGYGAHNGTSNAAPVVAGTFAKAIQRARELLGDTTETHADGVVASGQPVPCGSADSSCPLGDGVLTRSELERAIYSRVLPSAATGGPATTLPTTEYTYYYQGHGVIRGLVDGPTAAFAAEQAKILGALDGTSQKPARPRGEATWFVVDSKCRQKLWGYWQHGFYDRVSEPALDPTVDRIAIPFYAACTALPDEIGYRLAPTVAPVLQAIHDTVFADLP